MAVPFCLHCGADLVEKTVPRFDGLRSILACERCYWTFEESGFGRDVHQQYDRNMHYHWKRRYDDSSLAWPFQVYVRMIGYILEEDGAL